MYNRLVLSMLNVAYDTLLRESGSETMCQLSTTLPHLVPWSMLSATESEITVIFCICVLAEIGNAKNNIIGVCVRVFCLVDDLCRKNVAYFSVQQQLTA